jgi:hypothetical protein
MWWSCSGIQHTINGADNLVGRNGFDVCDRIPENRANSRILRVPRRGFSRSVFESRWRREVEPADILARVIRFSTRCPEQDMARRTTSFEGSQRSCGFALRSSMRSSPRTGSSSEPKAVRSTDNTASNSESQAARIYISLRQGVCVAFQSTANMLMCRFWFVGHRVCAVIRRTHACSSSRASEQVLRKTRFGTSSARVIELMHSTEVHRSSTPREVATPTNNVRTFVHTRRLALSVPRPVFLTRDVGCHTQIRRFR